MTSKAALKRISATTAPAATAATGAIEVIAHGLNIPQAGARSAPPRALADPHQPGG
ncbi:hypothetical protein ABLN64_12345 [Mycobacterium tuberculosis]